MNIDFWTALINSAIVAGAIAFSVVLFSTLAGFAFAKLQFRGNKVLMLVVVATLLVPGAARRDPALHRDEAPALDQPPAGGDRAVLVSAFGVFLMRQYIVAVRPERADRRVARRRLPHARGLLARRPARGPPGRRRARAAHVHERLERLLLAADRPHAAEPDRAGRGLDARRAATSRTTRSSSPAPSSRSCRCSSIFLVLGRQIIGGIMKGAVKG